MQNPLFVCFSLLFCRFSPHNHIFIDRKLDKHRGRHIDALGDNARRRGREKARKQTKGQHGQVHIHKENKDNQASKHRGGGGGIVVRLEGKISLEKKGHDLCQRKGDHKRQKGAKTALLHGVVEDEELKRRIEIRGKNEITAKRK